MEENNDMAIILANGNDFNQTLSIIDRPQDSELKLNQHEETSKPKKLHKRNLDKFEKTTNNYSNHEETTLKQRIINLHGNSSAGILLQFQAQYDPSILYDIFSDSILGVLCTLWEVEDPNLNSVLSEYLGIDTNLAIVCTSCHQIEHFEKGFHCLASSLKRIMEARLSVICIEDLCPYRGNFVYDDPQRTLDLAAPTLPNGKKPNGFLGFAVNMVNIKKEMLFDVGGCGYGLRETLFYSIFSQLQVYTTRECMMDALPCVSESAVSLDGAMVFSNGASSPCTWDDLIGEDMAL